MRITAIILLAACMEMSAKGYSQITYNAKRTPLEKVLQAIKKQSGYFLLYDYHLIQDAGPVDVQLKNASITDAMSNCLKDQPLNYSIEDKTIVITKKGTAIRAPAEEQVEQVTVSGIITSKTDNQPLIGASVIEAGNSKNGITANEKGFYSIKIPVNGSIEVNMMGYKKQQFTIKASRVINVAMEEDVAVLKDHIVLGYQVRSRRKSATAVASITGEDLKDNPATSLDVMMQGKLPGVDVQNFTGEPGVRNSVVIRGSTGLSTDFSGTSGRTSPLYVIDGVPLEIEDGGEDITGTFALAGININDVASIDVLKDAASAAIYGSRAANGVILITTKKGAIGKPKFNFRYTAGASEKTAGRTILGGAAERRARVDMYQSWKDWATEANLDSWLPQIVSDSLNPAFNGHTDWQNLLYTSALLQEANLGVSGGSDQIRYRMSVGYRDEDGIQIGTGLKRFTFSSSTNIRFSNIVGANLDVRYTRMDRQRPYSIISSNLPSSLYNLSEEDYKLYTGTYAGYQDKNIDHNLNMILQFNVSLARNFSFRSASSMVIGVTRRDMFKTSEVTKTGKPAGLSDALLDAKFNFDNYFDYQLKRGEFNLSLTAGNNVQTRQTNRTYLEATRLPNDNMPVITGALPKDLKGYTKNVKDNLVGFFGQMSLDYKERYILQGTYRMDGSSRFGYLNQFKPFPSVALGWIMSDEPFMKEVTFLNFLKFRASVGLTGNRPPSNANPYSSYKISDATVFTGGSDPTTFNGQSAVSPDYLYGLPQDDLSWERTVNYNGGMDIELLKSRVTISFDAYVRNSDGIFLQQRMPTTSGYSYSYTNAAGMRNKGLELGISTKNIIRKDFNWNSNIVLSRNTGVVTRLPYGEDFIFYSTDLGGAQAINRLSVGYPRYTQMLMHYLGVYENTGQFIVNPFTGAPAVWSNGEIKVGDAKYADLDNSYNFSALSGNDYYMGGGVDPGISGGIFNQFRYKQFTLSVQCNYTFMRHALNVALASNLRSVGSANNSLPDIYNMGFFMPSAEGKSGTGSTNYKYPGLNPYRSGLNMTINESDLFYENAAYFKVRNVNLSYNLPTKWSKRLRLSSARIFGVVDNVLILSSSPNMADPEAIDARGYYTGNLYDIPRRFTLGLDVNF